MRRKLSLVVSWGWRSDRHLIDTPTRNLVGQANADKGRREKRQACSATVPRSLPFLSCILHCKLLGAMVEMLASNSDQLK